jgi:hypothetical protein
VAGRNLSHPEGIFGFQSAMRFTNIYRIMRNILSPFLTVLLAVGMLVSSLSAEVVVENGQIKKGKFKLKDGTTISGEVIGPRGDGVAFRYDEGEAKGRFSARYKWEEFTQDTLKEFLQDSRVKKFVELLIEIKTEDLTAMQEEAIPVRAPRPPLELKPVPLAVREFSGASVFGALSSGSGLLLLLAIYGANLFAAYEIAYFRNYHFALVCGVAAVAPLVGPLIFVCLPTRSKHAVVEYTGPESGDSSDIEEEEEEEVMEAAPVYVEPVEVVAQIPATQVFRRGEVAINRRFIETKFAPFFRVIIGDAEKDLRLVVKSSKGEFIGNRVSKVTQTDMSLQITNEAGASVEETFPITDIFEIQVRHKDAPPQ